tara:strand:+ start:98 stop:1198 length:1101 start_codon:yes stop_codon:yes gene_type:complete
MRIIYGVSGEGSGHSSRAKEMATHLLGAGHEILFVSYDRGYAVLHTQFPCRRIDGLRIISVDNKVSMLRTLVYNLRMLPAYYRSLQALRRVFNEFEPDIVISDFEPMCARLATARGLPLISLDNQHRMRFMDYDSPARLRRDRWVTEQVIRAMVPKPNVALATTFLQGPVKNSHTFLFPPILRSEVGRLRPSSQGYHLVYVTSEYDTLIDTLREFPEQRFVVYGYNRNESRDNLQFKEFSTAGFLDDLAGCESVIATAGFTLMSEAMFLQKPYLAFPMGGQFEQQLNAHCLEQLGFGLYGKRADRGTVQHFFEELPQYREALSHYPDGYTNNPDAPRNLQICNKLDDLLTNDGALLRHFQEAKQYA